MNTRAERLAAGRLKWLVPRFGHLVLDAPLFGLALLVVGFGLIVLFSALGGSIDRWDGHAIRAGFAVLVMLAVAHLHPQAVFRLTPFVYVGGVLLLVATMTFGQEANNSRSWLGIPGLFRFQPSEMAKIAVVLCVAWYLSFRPYPMKMFDLLVVACIVALPCTLVFMQPDLGTAMMIVAPSCAMLVVAGFRIWWMVAGGLAMLASSPFLWMNLLPHQRSRVLTFFDPYQDPLGHGYNIIQSWIALGSGGLTGKGLMKGTQSRLDFLPEHHTDFILAVIGEELGFVFTAALLMALFAVFARCLTIATRTTDTFARLAITGIAMVFFCNVVVNVGMVLGLVPVVGVPLPLISYGGSSLITMLAGFGLIMALQKERKRWSGREG